MKPRLLARLACPTCDSGFRLDCTPAIDAVAEPEVEVESGHLVCDQGHTFAIRHGVPVLSPSSEMKSSAGSPSPERAIRESFSAEWEHFDYSESRTWHETIEDRKALVLRELDVAPDDLAGKLALDAGCGNGTLSEAIAGFGCDVLAIDASESVFAAHRHFLGNGTGRTHYLQGDLMHLPFRRGGIDFIYSSGVLHHNPDTLKAFRAVVRFLKPGGKMYVWLYHKEPGVKFWLQLRLRSVIAPMPSVIKHAFVRVWSIQSMLRQHIRTLFGVNDAKDRLTWKERIVDLLDIYTPRYRWMHTQDEVKGWYRDLGFSDVQTTEVRDWGFGVVGTAPESGRTDVAEGS